jgi:hypothetical protein
VHRSTELSHARLELFALASQLLETIPLGAETGFG